MKLNLPILLLVSGVLLAETQTVHGLTRKIGRDIHFPKGYETARAEALLAVVRDQQFEFIQGIVSYWPPDWSTRLSFTGDADSLNTFLNELRGVGIGLRVVLTRGESNELRSDSAWQLEFSQARPDEVTVWINVNSDLQLEKVSLPTWRATQE